MPVFASICCASNSPSTTCSVKNFDPMTSFSCRRTPQPQSERAVSERSRQIARRMSGHAQAPLDERQQPVGEQGENRRGDGSSEDGGIADHSDATKNKCSEPAGSD